MPVTIYHNPRCSKSRETLQLLKDKGLTPTVILYLETPPSKREFETLRTRLGLDDIRAMMRTKEELYKSLGLADPGKTPDQLLAILTANPILLERPVVVTDKGARICRPPELVEEII